MAKSGWYGNEENWRRIEAPLLLVDPILDVFAKRIEQTIYKNSKEWPDRSLIWGNEVRCFIQLYLADADELTFNLWICASQDRGGSRYWKNEMLIRGRPVSDFAPRLPELLEEGWNKLNQWAQAPEALEFAVELTPLPTRFHGGV